MGHVGHLDQIVLAPQEADPGPCQFPAKPFPPVQAYAQVERKPRLEADVHESEPWMLQIEVVMQALARHEPQFQLLDFSIRSDFERMAVLDATEHANKPFVDAIV